jgi:hypothetical protein
MPRVSAAGALALAALFSKVSQAGEGPADAGVELPAVVVPLPPPEAAPESPSRRDPTGAQTVVRP